MKKVKSSIIVGKLFIIGALLFLVVLLIWNGVARGAADQASGNPASPSTEQINRGEYLVQVASCRRCHGEGLFQNAGGGPFLAFADTVRDAADDNGGVRSPDRMPFKQYRLMTDPDIFSIYAWAFSRQHRPAGAWERTLREYELLTARNEPRFTASSTIRADQDRGAYLVLGPGNCTFCHGMSEDGRAEPGMPLLGGAEKNGWIAYNITSDPIQGVGAWSQGDTLCYMLHGVNGKGTASGPMAGVIDRGTRHLTRDDASAIYDYLKSVPAHNSGDTKARFSWGEPLEGSAGTRGPMFPLDVAATRSMDGQSLYNAHCASCHSPTGQGTGNPLTGGFPSLIRNSTVGDSTPQNLAMVLLEGGQRDTAYGTFLMPDFKNTLSDNEAARLINFVTSRFGNPDAVITPAHYHDLRQRL